MLVPEMVTGALLTASRRPPSLRGAARAPPCFAGGCARIEQVAGESKGWRGRKEEEGPNAAALSASAIRARHCNAVFMIIQPGDRCLLRLRVLACAL